LWKQVPEMWTSMNEFWQMWDVQICLRLILASFLGAIIGLEREHHGRSAGMRTQFLVALGSALAMVVSLNFEKVFGSAGAASAIRIDPARVAYGVMGGIGFLGAGTIVRYGINIRGMTTAASLWCTAALGLACGFGMYLVSVVAAGLTLFALLVLSKFDDWVPINWYKTITVTLQAGKVDHLDRIRKVLEGKGVRVIDSEYTRDEVNQEETLAIHVCITTKNRTMSLNWLDGLSDVRKVVIRSD
jgi:putative Mg2+ transporter-C (MgtC) family protein